MYICVYVCAFALFDSSIQCGPSNGIQRTFTEVFSADLGLHSDNREPTTDKPTADDPHDYARCH